MPTHKSDHSGDLSLARRIAEGDEAACEELVKKHSRQLEFYALSHGVMADECQDVVQDALIAAIGQIRKSYYRGEASLGTWLHQILRGKIGDYFRKNKLQLNDQLDYMDGVGDQNGQVLDGRKNFITYLEVSEAVEKLPSRLKIILLMKLSEGFTIEEISRWLGVSLGKASRELYKAQKLFKQHIMNEQPRKKKRQIK